MQQFETKHRKYQVLKWIKALEEGYPGTGKYPPTISNLSLHMVEAGVHEDALKAKFGNRAFLGGYSKDMLNYMKSYLLTLMSNYQRYIFNEQEVIKRKGNSYALEKGLESRSGYKVTGYFLSTRGRRELKRLHEMARRHHELTPTTYRQDSVDELTLPKKKRRTWGVTEQVLRRNTNR